MDGLILGFTTQVFIPKLKKIYFAFRTPVCQVLGPGGEQRHRLSPDESSAGKHRSVLSVSYRWFVKKLKYFLPNETSESYYSN
jgi:hypothetical protein